MKKFKLFLVLSFLVFLYSCTNYEHGPVFSFKSANTRISGSWELTDIIINDNTDEVLLESERTVIYNLTEDGTIIATNVTQTRSASENIGVWTFNDDKSEISVSFASASSPVILKSDNYKILRLTNDELWISDEISVIKQCEYVIERRYSKISE